MKTAKGLLRRFLVATLVAMITSVFVKRYFYVSFFEQSGSRKLKLHVLDVQSTLNPLLFVVCLDTEYLPCGFVYAVGMV